MSVAKAYAKAFYQAATETGTKSSQMDQIQEQLDQFAGLFTGSREARVTLLNPAVSTNEKTQVVAKLTQQFGITGVLANFLQLLARKDRMSIVTDMSRAFAEVRLQAEGGMMGEVVSADPLQQSDIDGLSQAFTQKLGKKVAFRAETDPELLAGVKVIVNGVTYDGTLRSQLQRLRDQLVQGTGLSH